MFDGSNDHHLPQLETSFSSSHMGMKNKLKTDCRVSSIQEPVYSFHWISRLQQQLRNSFSRNAWTDFLHFCNPATHGRLVLIAKINNFVGTCHGSGVLHPLGPLGSLVLGQVEPDNGRGSCLLRPVARMRTGPGLMHRSERVGRLGRSYSKLMIFPCQ